MSSPNRALRGPDAKDLPVSDEQVVRRVRAGETDMFEVVMRRYNRRLYRVALAILRNDAEAEDVTQQAYVNAYGHLGQFAGRAMFSTWLTKIAVHEALARARRRGRFNEQDVDDWDGETIDELRSPGPDPERQAFAGELRALMESAIDALPERYRAVSVMREIEGGSPRANRRRRPVESTEARLIGRAGRSRCDFCGNCLMIVQLAHRFASASVLCE